MKCVVKLQSRHERMGKVKKVNSIKSIKTFQIVVTAGEDNSTYSNIAIFMLYTKSCRTIGTCCNCQMTEVKFHNKFIMNL